VALADRPTTTTDAGGWTESPDQPSVEPQGQNTELPAAQGTNGLDAAGQAIEPEEAHEGNEPPRRPDGRFEKNGFRRRAASQQATAEDVPRIQELTRRLRQTERERDEARAGGVVPAANGSTPAPAPKPAPGQPAPSPNPPPTAPSRQAIPPPPPPFTLREPEWNDFANSPDQARDYTKAVARYAQAEERHERAVHWHEQASAGAAQREDGELKALTQAHWGRMAVIGQDPKHQALVAQFQHDDRPITPAVLQAVVRMGEKSAETTIAILSTPGLLEELTLATYDRPATPDLVALVQRRLQSLGLSAATTGSVTAPAPTRPAPRPPNPVRTAPEAPLRDLPGDDASMAEHAAAFHQPRRSRLRRDR
jgi:hypothetical protein